MMFDAPPRMLDVPANVNQGTADGVSEGTTDRFELDTVESLVYKSNSLESLEAFTHLNLPRFSRPSVVPDCWLRR